MSEVGAAYAWIISTLQANDALSAAVVGVYGDLVPQGSSFPAIVVACLSSTDETAAGGARGATVAVMAVRATTKDGGRAAADAIVDLFDPLLDAKKGSALGHRILECRGAGQIGYPEIAGGIRYNHVGRQYRVTVEG